MKFFCIHSSCFSMVDWGSFHPSLQMSILRQWGSLSGSGWLPHSWLQGSNHWLPCLIRLRGLRHSLGLSRPEVNMLDIYLNKSSWVQICATNSGGPHHARTVLWRRPGVVVEIIMIVIIKAAAMVLGCFLRALDHSKHSTDSNSFNLYNNLQNRYCYYPRFITGETKAQRGKFYIYINACLPRRIAST